MKKSFWMVLLLAVVMVLAACGGKQETATPTASVDTAEQNMLANFLYLTAQTILTNAASQHLIETKIHGERMNLNSKEVIITKPNGRTKAKYQE